MVCLGGKISIGFINDKGNAGLTRRMLSDTKAMLLSIFLGKTKTCAFYKFFLALGAGDAQTLCEKDKCGTVF